MRLKIIKPSIVTKSFKVPIDVIEDLEALSVIHGSMGRAIQVGTELLIRMSRKPRVEPAGKVRIPVVAQSYSILPRTVELIERLLPCYEKRGTVLRAVVHVLREQP